MFLVYITITIAVFVVIISSYSSSDWFFWLLLLSCYCYYYPVVFGSILELGYPFALLNILNGHPRSMIGHWWSLLLMTTENLSLSWPPACWKMGSFSHIFPRHCLCLSLSLRSRVLVSWFTPPIGCWNPQWTGGRILFAKKALFER